MRMMDKQLSADLKAWLRKCHLFQFDAEASEIVDTLLDDNKNIWPVGITGDAGCGKSTIANCIQSFLESRNVETRITEFKGTIFIERIFELSEQAKARFQEIQIEPLEK
jgi:ABC-type glutathione transport system ATPase component